MEKKAAIHMFDPMEHTSPFDVNMAVDAGFDMVIPYAAVKLDQIQGLVQDAIFSREPDGVKRTALFIGGRDIDLSMQMLEAARSAMVPPFEVSILVDPSGSFTTAAALVASVERELRAKHEMELKGCRAVVFGGTGPVGIATGVIASLAGADVTIVDHRSIETASEIAERYNKLCGSAVRGTYACSDADKAYLLKSADIVFCTAKAGVEVLNDFVLNDALALKVAGDVNAVPPRGIKGIKAKDFGAPLTYAGSSPGAVGVGALSVGDIKYRLQQMLLHLMLETDKPVFLEFRAAFVHARSLV
jgi:methylene-tetrahydromethanopterin dehydrogenase